MMRMRVTAVFWLVLGHLSVCQGWSCSPGVPLKGAAQVDGIAGQLVATDARHHAYSLEGDKWKELPFANLKHITVGEAGTWGIDVSDRILKYLDGRWVKLPGQLKQIDAGGIEFVAGVNSINKVWCLRSQNTMDYGHASVHVTWTEIGGTLKYFSCGPYGCWGVNRLNHIYFNKLKSAATCSYYGWKLIGGTLKMIDVGSDGRAFGVNRLGRVYERTGITRELPQGTGWRYIRCLGSMKQVTYDLGTIYGVSTTGVIMKATE